MVPHSAVDLAALAGTAGFAFDPADYPVPTSDIAALLALEQQVTVHNLLIRALLQMRCLLENDRALDAALGEDGMRDPTADIADDLAHAITAALLFADEVGLQGRDAAADPTFARAFPALWPADPSGLRLGRFDLTARTFVLPLSPMVHSRAFAALPDPLRRLALKRLRRALVRNWLPGRVALPPEQRQALHDHLTATLPGYGS
ncbi:MAG: hypothetical protein KDE27_26020 [Planctomycetes bacterium]|nr:hypothetical protein [Planctomycetota bacterium]